MKYIAFVSLMALVGCTNCYNHVNSDNRSNGGCTKSVVKPSCKPAVTKAAPSRVASNDEYILTSTTKEYVGSYLILH